MALIVGDRWSERHRLPIVATRPKAAGPARQDSECVGEGNRTSDAVRDELFMSTKLAAEIKAAEIKDYDGGAAALDDAVEKLDVGLRPTRGQTELEPARGLPRPVAAQKSETVRHFLG